MAVTHIKNHPYTMGPAIALLMLTAIAAVALGVLSTRPFMQNWMSHKVLGHERWKWLVGGAIAATTLALALTVLSLVIKASPKKDPQPSEEADQQLAYGWVSVTKDTGQTYYWHAETKTSTWERPSLELKAVEGASHLPQGWTVKYDPTAKCLVYTRPDGGAQFKHPKVPAGWNTGYVESTNMICYYTPQGKKVWLLPDQV